MPKTKKEPGQGRPAGGTASVCWELAAPFARQLGLTLWDVRFVKEGADWFLRVVIDKDGGVGIDDCVDMTHLLSPALDKADPISQSYCLEVTSPGIERELTRPEHFEAYEGWPVVVKTIRPVDGIREFAGILLQMENGDVSIQTEEDETLTFAKKDIAAVHAIDDWDEDEALLDQEIDGGMTENE